MSFGVNGDKRASLEWPQEALNRSRSRLRDRAGSTLDEMAQRFLNSLPRLNRVERTEHDPQDAGYAVPGARVPSGRAVHGRCEHPLSSLQASRTPVDDPSRRARYPPGYT